MKDLLAKLDALHEKATPGEWQCDGPHEDDASSDILHASRSLVGEVWGNWGVGEKRDGGCMSLNDAASIVALHNHWPEVRSYIAKLEAAAGELTEQVTSEKHE